MPAPLSQDLRARVAASLDEGLSYTEVQERFGVSRNFVATFARRYRATGSILPLPPDPGPDPTLGARERGWLESWLREQSDLTQGQLVDRLAEHGVAVHRTTVSRALAEMGWSRKKSRWWPQSSSQSASRRNAARGSTRSARA